MVAVDRAADVLIVGGGPAGAAVALAVEASDLASIIVERSRYAPPRIGEHLPPGAQPFLDQLGLWEQLSAGPHLRSPGVRAAWGSATLREQDYLFSPFGHGWNLDRSAFDASLGQAAAAAGTEVLTGTRIVEMKRGDGMWQMRLAGGANDGRIVSARFLVDATGRAATLARRLGGRRRVVDNLIALCAWLPAQQDGENTRLVVEAAKGGWWYTALLPGDRRVAVFLGDRDLIPGSAPEARSFWAEELARTLTVRTLVGADKEPNLFRLRAANTYLLAPIFGDGWLAVGDAASAFDPLSSMGILKALSSGVAAATAITQWLAGNDGALAAYAEEIERIFVRYLRDRHLVYSRERRWQDGPFWRRRLLRSGREADVLPRGDPAAASG